MSEQPPGPAAGTVAGAASQLAKALERHRSQAALRHRDQHTRLIVGTADAAFVETDGAGTIVDWNRRAEATFGWSREEVLGRSLAETLIPERYRAAHDEALANLLAAGHWSIFHTSVEGWGLHRSGREMPIELTVWPLRVGRRYTFNGFLQDVSARRAAESARAQLAAIVESSDDAIISLTLDGVITSWNAGAERAYGYAAGEAVGRSLQLIVPDERVTELAGWLGEVNDGRAARAETRWRTRKGTDLDVALTLSPVHGPAGVISGASAITRDITEERWMAGTLDSTLDALEEALAEARESETRSKRFLADAAHQLRTPIAGIQACAEALLLGSPADRDHLLTQIVRETSRASRLMRELLRMARLDTGEALVLVPIDLVALCQEEVERARSLAPDLDLRLVVEGTPPARPLLDAGAVAGILSNLVENARRHATSRVELTVAGAPGALEVRVADDGPGIPEELAEHIFE
ncbi:MAG: PAS domain-containing sensor histidine kinase, partial [Acidimicrobiales bacterium]